MRNRRKLFSFCVIAVMMSGYCSAFGDDIKDTVDAALHHLRATQNSDGSYGSVEDSAITTPLVVLAFGTSPRRYTDMDGPFVRKAVEWIAGNQRDDGSIRPESRLEEACLMETALSMAAMASVNRIRWEKQIDMGCAYLHTSMKEGERKRGYNLFHDSLCLGITQSPQFASLINDKNAAPETRLQYDSYESIQQSIWILETFKHYKPVEKFEPLITRLADSMGKLQAAIHADPAKAQDGFIAMDLWAGIYLLSLCHDRGVAPEGWANQISEPLIILLSSLLEKKEAGHTDEIGTLVNALSLCHGKTSMPSRGMAQPEGPALSPFVAQPLPLKDALVKALDFMNNNQNNGKFGFHGYPDPGISALALSGVIRANRIVESDSPAYIKAGLEYLTGLQKEDGSIYQTGLANYVTSAAIMALSDAKDESYIKAIEAARNFLIVLQADETEGYSLEEDPFFGGMGYGSDERPDLSNTQMAVEALRTSGLDAEHEAFKKAVQFLQKCQNLTEVNPTRIMINPTKEVVSGNDGGGIYYPGSSKADLDQIEEGLYVARSYGSMTYALLKSYLLAGLNPEDKRVQAAVNWIRSNFTLDSNPGFKSKEGQDLDQQGLYYYYLTMARALDCLGVEEIVTPDGSKHAWRQELKAKMLSLQREDGSWVNHRSPRWFEGNPVLATAYALLVLDICAEK